MPTLVDGYADAPARVWRPDFGPWHFTIRKWDGPERTMVFVLAIVAITILGAIAMLPNTEEKAQVLVSQGQSDAAIALYEQKHDTVRLNPFETYSLAGLYDAGGQIDALTRLLEEEIVVRPQSAWARDWLVQLYRADGRLADEARILVQTFALDPSQTDFRRLLGLYRLLDDRAAERAALEAAHSAGLTGAADLSRLDHLTTNSSSVGTVIWRASDRAGGPQTPSSEFDL